MAESDVTLSRAQMIAGVLATGALAACGRTSNATPATPPAPLCVLPTASPVSIEQIFSDPAFANLDTAGILAAFDHSAQIEALYGAYASQNGQLLQSGFAIAQIPVTGLVITTPGTYTFTGNLTWNAGAGPAAAITIASSNVTLDLGGYTLTIVPSDVTQQIAGIRVAGPTANPATANIRITNGTVANAVEYGIIATSVCGISITNVTVSGLCMNDLATRFLTPSGILVSESFEVAISDCTVTQSNVTTDSSAGIFLQTTIGASITHCTASDLVNNDGAVIGFSAIKCVDVTTTDCLSQSLQTHFNGNILTSGHTVLGFCPILSWDLTYVECTANGMAGCCDDCHGMSVFLDGQVTVRGFSALNVTDGVSPENSGAKATGLEVYGVGVMVSDCSVTNIKAINPQDKQSTGFSAWGLDITFERCNASDVSVVSDLQPGSLGEGFGWAPDPRPFFRDIGAYDITYADCTATSCDVGFDTWFHQNSTWTNPVATNCTTAILVQPDGQRTISGNPCSECNPPITVTLTNIAKDNTYPS